MEQAKKVQIPIERKNGECKNDTPHVILASKSAIRKKKLTEEGIPFEVIVSEADETPNENKSFKAILAEIAMRKAKVVLDKTANRGTRLIIAADQNIVFEGKMYGKPKDINEAREIIQNMRGRDDIYAYTGNAVLLADGDEALETVNVTDIARMYMDEISDEEIEKYLKNTKPLTKCGGILIDDAPFLHLKEGRYSTACGMTTEIAKEMLKTFYNC